MPKTTAKPAATAKHDEIAVDTAAADVAAETETPVPGATVDELPKHPFAPDMTTRLGPDSAI